MITPSAIVFSIFSLAIAWFGYMIYTGRDLYEYGHDPKDGAYRQLRLFE